MRDTAREAVSRSSAPPPGANELRDSGIRPLARSRRDEDQPTFAVRAVLFALGFHVAIGIVLACVLPALALTKENPRPLLQAVLFGACLVVGWGASKLGARLFALRRSLEQEAEPVRVGRYRAERLLARGGMGEIWIARDSTLERDVALKILAPDANRDDEALSRFENEVKTMTRLSHPNTVRVYDCGTTNDGAPFFAMELLDGEHLGALVRREGPLVPRRSAALVLQAARAIGEAHDAGIVHGDVKPENLFLQRTRDGQDFVKVLDFGISRSSEKLVVNGEAATFDLGTPKSASPEVIEGSRATPASDVYGLGVVLYELVTGQPPFATDHALATMIAHLTLPPIAPSDRRAFVPKSLDVLVLRCLAKRPVERYADARALAEALERFLAEPDEKPRPAPRKPEPRVTVLPRGPLDLSD